MTLWTIVGTKWVIKMDAIAGGRTDRKSKNKTELPKKQVTDLAQVEVFNKANKNKAQVSNAS